MTDRGVSVTVGYVLGLAVATLLITGLVYGAGEVVGDRRETTVRSELQVVGERIASDVQTADRLVSTGASTVVVESDLPGTVAGSGYTVTVNATAELVVLETRRPDVVVSVPLRVRTPVVAGSATGGDLRIALDGSGALEVSAA